MKKLQLFLTMLTTICALQVCFAQERNETSQPYIKVIDCKNCNEIAISLPNPEYSLSIGYGAHKYSGKLFVQILINEEGNVQSAKSILGHPFFRQIVEKAALKAKFKPTIVSEKLVEVTGIIVYEVNPANLEQLAEEKILKGGIINGKASYLPKPDYPQNAKDFCASGKVEVEVLIDEKGDVISAEAISGDELLRDSAVEAVKKAKFNSTGHLLAKVKGIIVYNFVPEKKCIDVGIVNKKARFIPKPEFPKSCRCSGQVVVQVIINILSGKVTQARAVSGHPLLRISAVNSAKQAIFAPTLININRLIYAKGIIIYNFLPTGNTEF